jgi:2-keto-4-pentenoate hydratase
MLLLEYSTSPSWFFTVFDEYNYGNADESLKIHYPNASVAFVKDALRVQGGYGRVRGGILCVGGICRPVPASNGLTLSVTFTF